MSSLLGAIRPSHALLGQSCAERLQWCEALHIDGRDTGREQEVGMLDTLSRGAASPGLQGSKNGTGNSWSWIGQTGPCVGTRCY
jgi:hypothetical protein